MTNTIEATGLTKRFGKIQALDGLDLVAEPGQVVAVLGPNGAGKTTFVRASRLCFVPTAVRFTWPAMTWAASPRPFAR